MNAVQDRIYYELLLPAAARRWGADVLLMPVNLSARKMELPQVVTIHDVNFITNPETYDGWFRAYATRMFARTARDADAITTVSDFSRTRICELLGIAPTRVEVVYPGLDPVPTRTAPITFQEPYALFLGATEPHKNVDVLLDAWSSDPAPPLSLVIAGRPGRAHAALEERASKLGSKVVMLGQLDQGAVETWYRNASLFLFPSLAEGFGYPPLEAMARGVPVISSNAASLPEVLGDAARYHDPRDAEGLRHHVESLMSDNDAREQLISRGRAQAARYNWAATGRAMAAVLSAVATTGGLGAGRPDDVNHRRGRRNVE